MGHVSRLFKIRHAHFVRKFFLSRFSTESNSNVDVPLDRIDLRSLQFYGFHGVGLAEKKKGQNFVVDATLFLHLAHAGYTDSLSCTVNYASVLRDLEKVMKGPSVDLIEHLAEMMCYRLLEGYPLIQKVQISIRKPEAPLPCPTDSFDHVGVTLFRRREDFKFVPRQDDDEFDD